MLVLVAGCAHELSRVPQVSSAHVGLTSTRFVVEDRVETHHPCGFGHYAAYVLTFGLAWWIDSVMENKLGHHGCPSDDTTYERKKQVTVLAGSVDPPRAISDTLPRCVFASPEEQCIVEDHDRHVPAWVPQDLHVVAVAPDDATVVAVRYGNATTASFCGLVTSYGGRMRLPTCDHPVYLDRRTLVLGASSPGAQVLDVETGAPLGDGHPILLGAGLAALWHQGSIDIILRNTWEPIASVELRAALSEPDEVVLIGRTAIVEIRPDAAPVTIPLEAAIGTVHEVRGNLAAVTLPAYHHVALIDLTTGRIVMQSRW